MISNINKKINTLYLFSFPHLPSGCVRSPRGWRSGGTESQEHQADGAGGRPAWGHSPGCTALPVCGSQELQHCEWEQLDLHCCLLQAWVLSVQHRTGLFKCSWSVWARGTTCQVQWVEGEGCSTHPWWRTAVLRGCLPARRRRKRFGNRGMQTLADQLGVICCFSFLFLLHPHAC